MSAGDSDSYGSRRRLAPGSEAASRSVTSVPSTTTSGKAGGAYYQPGTPIGYLAARGTPFEKKYFSKKLGFCCLFLTPPILLVTFALTLVPILGAIADHALHTSQFHVESSNITNIGNTSFSLTLGAQVSKTGIFPAHLYFRKPTNVYWMSPPPNMREIHLGHFNLSHVGAAAGHATVNQATTFYIDNVEGFATFAEYLVSQPVFTWRINCSEVHAEAFSFFPVYKPLPLQKNIVIKGLNNLQDVHLIDVQLPGNDPAGGIQVSATATLVNPSPFGIEVGTLVLGLYYDGLFLGPVMAERVNVKSGVNLLTLNGRLIPYQNDVPALQKLGVLFTNYINSVPTIVIARGVSVTQRNGDVITWLQQGITALNTQIPFLPPVPIDPIKGITINYISLVYSEQTPYNPILFSNTLTGQFSLPFGFSLNITQLATEITILYQGRNVGKATGPYAAANTNIQLLSTGVTAGHINLRLPPSQLILPNKTDAAKIQLIQFENAFVYMASAAFQAQGAAKALTDTPVGEILLDGIKFDVTTGLEGLNGLLTYDTTINSVDVIGGTPSAVQLAVGLTVVNPSNLNLSVGDVTFQLSNEVVLGTATLPNLILMPGRNDLASTSEFDPNRDPKGLETLNRFISGQSTFLKITGFDGSTKIESLITPLAGLKLNSTLPALSRPLVRSANLTVLATTGIQDDVANSIVYIDNPFTSGLVITHITATASSHGIYLAAIDTNLNYPVAGKTVTASPNVPLSINLYPPDLFGLLRALVQDSGQDVAYLDGLVSLAGFTLTPTTSANTPGTRNIKRDASFVDEEESTLTQRLMGTGSNAGLLDILYDEDQEANEDIDSDGIAKRAIVLENGHLSKRANIYTGFNLGDYVLRAFQGATADLSITSDATIGEYGTTLTFSQNNVALGTDATLLLLLPTLATPIVQKIVDTSILNIDRVTITEARADRFTASLQGALTNAGPFDAQVAFPNGLEIYWEGQLLTATAFPNVALVGDVGSAINVQLEGRIPDVNYFARFLAFAITNPSFLWNVRGTGLTVAALGITVTGVNINKDVQLTGLNNLAGNVIINSFDLPSNSPAGGLALTAETTINNPAQVGVFLTQFGVNIFDGPGSILIGPSAAGGAFTLQALSVTSVPLVGRLIPQTNADGLASLSNIFTRFVQNQNTPVTVVGDFAGPSDVAWLNQGIKALKVTVILPSQSFEVIRLISLNQLSLFFTVPTAYNPQTDSSNTAANFFLPFAFPLDITQISGPFTLNYNAQDMAVLNIPPSPATTNVEARILTLMFTNVPLAIMGNARMLFSNFVSDFTKSVQVTANLHGTANALANTAAGALTITDIPFDLNTNLLGLQNLNARPATVANLDVVRGFPTYLRITVDTNLFNPSDTTVGAGDVSFGVLFQNNLIGNAVINNIVLVPGVNTVPTAINYMPMGGANVASGQLLLENYVQNVTSNALVAGNDQTTPIPSLLQGLSGINLATDIPPLEKLIVIQASLVVPRDIAQTGIALAAVQIANPFTASINIINLLADANFKDITVGTINQNLGATNKIIRAPGKVTTQSQQIPINLNIDPKNLIRFIIEAAATYNVGLGPLPPFFQRVLDLPDTRTTIMPVPDDVAPPCNSGRAFDTLGAILALLRPLQASISIQSVVKIDEYQTGLNFIQQPVPVATDHTALYLVGPAAAPLIQLIVNSSVLVANLANATNLINSGFTVSLLGSLGTDAPADAYIELPDGITIQWQGSDIAQLTLSPLCSSPPDGIPILQATGQLTITNEQRFEDFTYFLLTEPNFQWFLHTNTARVRALGISFNNVVLEKTIQLDAFNGLPGLRITQFSAPSDAPGRINIRAETPIPSPASLGVELDNASFELFFQGSDIGTITSELLFLSYKGTTNAVFNGFLKSQVGNTKGLADIGILFSQFLAGQDSTLTIRGLEVRTRANNNAPVVWLTNAFKRFQDTVVLPGKIYQIIFSITLSDLTVTVKNRQDSYNVLSSNNQTVATFSNPFGFGLTPLSVAPRIILSYLGVNTATLNLPQTQVQAGTSRGPQDIQPITFGFRNQFINAIDQNQFQAFFAKLADTPGADFGLGGVTDVIAGTQIGNPLITGIPFQVTTTLAGINSFNGVAGVSNVQVNNPTNAFIGINLMVQLENPSQITLFTDEISLPTLYTTRNVVIGRATIPALNLYPGTNMVISLFQFMIPGNDTNVQEVLMRYLDPVDFTTAGQIDRIPLTIQGQLGANPALSPYPSLDQALAGVKLTATLDGIATRIVTAIRVYIPLSVITQQVAAILGTVLAPVTGQPANGDIFVYAFLDAVNEIPSEIDFEQLSSTIFDTTNPGAGQYARFTQDFPRGQFVLPAAVTTNQPSRQTTTSPQINNILLSKGLAASLPLIGKNLNTNNYVRAFLQGPAGAYRIPGLHYIENNIPTQYFASAGTGDVLGLPLKPVGDLLGLINQLSPGLLQTLTGLLGALNPNNPAAVFQALGQIPGAGGPLLNIFCSTGGLSALNPAACAPATTTAASTAPLVQTNPASIATAINSASTAIPSDVAAMSSALGTSILNPSAPASAASAAASNLGVTVP